MEGIFAGDRNESSHSFYSQHLDGWSCSVTVWRGCSGNFAFCLSCDECNLMCLKRGSIRVSVCKIWVFVSCVHPVASMRHVFCLVYNFIVLVGFMIGDQMVLA